MLLPAHALAGAAPGAAARVPAAVARAAQGGAGHQHRRDLRHHPGHLLRHRQLQVL